MKWQQILENRQNADKVRKEDLTSLGKPVFVKTRLQDGTQYRFVFSDGARVEVVEKGTNPLVQEVERVEQAPCCRAMSSECLSCRAHISEFQYCLGNPNTAGCSSSGEIVTPSDRPDSGVETTTTMPAAASPAGGWKMIGGPRAQDKWDKLIHQATNAGDYTGIERLRDPINVKMEVVEGFGNLRRDHSSTGGSSYPKSASCYNAPFVSFLVFAPDPNNHRFLGRL